MIRALEFHDSRLMTISEAIGRTEIVLRGYVHQWERHRDVWKAQGGSSKSGSGCSTGGKTGRGESSAGNPFSVNLP